MLSDDVGDLIKIEQIVHQFSPPFCLEFMFI